MSKGRDQFCLLLYYVNHFPDQSATYSEPP